VEGIYFGEIFYLVEKLASIRFILSIATTFDLEVEKMDVKKTFSHGDIEEKIYMKHPTCFTVNGNKDLVFKLKKSMYGLKKSPRMWFQNYDTCLLGLGFLRIKYDYRLYSK
jgi:hypothetical protein